ncbi:CoA-transferase [Cupriavidus sp. RAF12]|uniref:CoA-transferase n=1 Tax=Cupriavidus sp. RAF12 TaxID=3233050 RepID=UPI003F930F51
MEELVRQGKRDLTVIANDTATPGRGIAKLVTAGIARKAIVSHIGLNPETQRKMIAGEMEVELVPQGTLVERIRAAGCGLGGILTPTGTNRWRPHTHRSSKADPGAPSVNPRGAQHETRSKRGQRRPATGMLAGD